MNNHCLCRRGVWRITGRDVPGFSVIIFETYGKKGA